MRILRARGAAIGVCAAVGMLGAAAGLGVAQEKGAHDTSGPETVPPAAPGDQPAAVADPGSADAQASPASVAPPEEPTPAVAAPAEAPDAVAPPEKPPIPLVRPRYGAAVLQAVDKITAATLRFEARVGEPVRYKSLIVTVKACETTAADEGFADSAANLQVVFQPEPIVGRTSVTPREVFQGWMFASSPGLHPLEQPGYDVWMIACKAAS